MNDVDARNNIIYIREHGVSSIRRTEKNVSKISALMWLVLALLISNGILGAAIL
tara:strand:+ start:893 stop:1054 length:162 start_codon:yes stop_codon:yes gene_type:complete